MDEGVAEVIGVAVTASLSSQVTVQSNVMTPILAVRLNPNNPNLDFMGKAFDLYNTDNTTDILYKVYRDPSFNKNIKLAEY